MGFLSFSWAASCRVNVRELPDGRKMIGRERYTRLGAAGGGGGALPGCALSLGLSHIRPAGTRRPASDAARKWQKKGDYVAARLALEASADLLARHRGCSIDSTPPLTNSDTPTRPFALPHALRLGILPERCGPTGRGRSPLRRKHAAIPRTSSPTTALRRYSRNSSKRRSPISGHPQYAQQEQGVRTALAICCS